MRIAIILAISFLCITACSGYFLRSYSDNRIRIKQTFEDRALRLKMMDKQIEIEMRRYRNIFKNMNSWMRKRF